METEIRNIYGNGRYIFSFIVFLWIVAPLVSANTSNPELDSLDFEWVKKWVEDKRIVALGESTHGIGDFYALKANLVKYLHEELGFDVLAFEGGFADLQLGWANIDQVDGLQLRDKCLFGNFRCSEIEPLFEYIKREAQTNQPLIVAGFDTQISGSFYEGHLDSIIGLLELGIDLGAEFSLYNKMYQASLEADSTHFVECKERYQKILTSLQSSITENKSWIAEELALTDYEIDLVLRGLAMQFKAVDYTFAQRMNEEYIPKGIEIRDQLMAKNVEWIVDSLYPDKKVILWGHNAHLQSGAFNNLEMLWMGQHLKKKYGSDYFSIGLFAYKGKIYQHWSGDATDVENSDSSFIEHKMTNGLRSFVYQKFSDEADGHWIYSDVQAFEPENGGAVNFVPADRFDAAICILKGDIPNFLSN